jgi:dihydroorotate dehydrogenase (NAD+) catalytic subunit
MGGVTSGQDVVDFVACGARDVALGTVLFADPDAPARVRAEIAAVDLDEAFASAHKLSHVLA